MSQLILDCTVILVSSFLSPKSFTGEFENNSNGKSPGGFVRRIPDTRLSVKVACFYLPIATRRHQYIFDLSGELRYL